MKVYSIQIDPLMVRRAFGAIGESFTATVLANKLEELGIPKVVGLNYVSISAASRIIQAWQEEGKIKKVYGGGGNTVWEKR